MLNIDLDALIAARRETKDSSIAENIARTKYEYQLKNCIEDIQEYLCSIPFESKPSTRFAVRDSGRPNPPKLSSGGMTIITKHVEKVTSTLAYLTIILEP